MADRPSVKDILAAARKGGPAQPSGGAAPESPPAESAAAPAATPTPAPAAGGAAPAASLGRPLTLKEKLAAARGELPAASAPAPAPPAASAAPASEAAGEKTVAAPAEPLGRPLTLKEKLAAARGGAAAPAAAGAAPAPAAKPAAAKAAAAPAKAARELPPLSEMNDPKDLAEALRQTGAKKTAETAPKEEKKPAKAPKAAEVKVVPGRPSQDAALAPAGTSRRGFIRIPWVAAGWTAFTAGTAAFTAMLGRFMFPNVLAEPPSTIKVGVPVDFARGEVSEKWKNEWGFWIVRSDMYNGQDIIYALQSVCTHLGCPPNWLAGEQKFKCPCHGSGFYVSGVNFEGPAPRPLERFKISIGDDGQMVVDKSQKFQEELLQWNDPDSYLPAV